MTHTLERHYGLIVRISEWAHRKWGGGTSEWIGLVTECMLDAIRTYKPELGFAFSTHAVKSCRLKMLQRAAKERGCYRTRVGNGKMVMMAQPVSMTCLEDDRPIEAVARTPYQCSNEDAIHAESILDAIRGNLNDFHYQVAKHIMGGMSQDEVASALGSSKSGVRQALSRIRKMWGVSHSNRERLVKWEAAQARGKRSRAAD